MRVYVLGFAFVPSTGQVLLIKKNKPDWQKGLLNGIGGKVEPDEAPGAAMLREAIEEAALTLDWQYRGMLSGVNDDGQYFVCHVYRAADEDVAQYLQMEEEELGLYDATEFVQHPHIENLEWLIPLLKAETSSPVFHAQYFRSKNHDHA